MSNPADSTSPYGPAQTAYRPAVARPTNGIAVAALVLGIIAIALGAWSVIPMLGLVAAFFAFVPAVLALIFGIVGMSKAKAVGVGRGQALAGVVLGSVTMGIMVLTTFAWFVLGSISG